MCEPALIFRNSVVATPTLSITREVRFFYVTFVRGSDVFFNPDILGSRFPPYILTCLRNSVQTFYSTKIHAFTG